MSVTPGLEAYESWFNSFENNAAIVDHFRHMARWQRRQLVLVHAPTPEWPHGVDVFLVPHGYPLHLNLQYFHAAWLGEI